MNGCPVERAGRVHFFVKYTICVLTVRIFRAIATSFEVVRLIGGTCTKEAPYQNNKLDKDLKDQMHGETNFKHYNDENS